MSLIPGKTYHTTFASKELRTRPRKLGAGGQAIVVGGTHDGKDVAVKDFHPEFVTPVMKRQIEEVVLMGSPHPEFAWPFDYLSTSGTLAVVMPLISGDFRGIPDLLALRVSPSFRVLAIVCFNLADAFFALHARGLCFLDINLNNVLFCPRTGAIGICDCENVAVNRSGYVSLATPGCMAPEVGMGASGCTILSDHHSLAVLLFHILFVAHPFQGQKDSAIGVLSPDDAHRVLCREPVFIFHSADTSNRPDPRLHASALRYWPIYPAFIRHLFTRAFTGGVARPESERVLEIEWRKAFIALCDAIFTCPCGAEVFHDAIEQQRTCWNCQRTLRPPLRLRFKTCHEVPLVPTTLLFPHHIGGSRFNFAKALAQVVCDNRDARMGLRNLSTTKWVVKRTDGTLVDAIPGATVALIPGTTIYFSGDEAEVCV